MATRITRKNLTTAIERLNKSSKRKYKEIEFQRTKVSLEDFKIVDNFIDLMAPEYEAKTNEAVRKVRRAWGRILLAYGQ